jgi:hypothetical protein
MVSKHRVTHGLRKGQLHQALGEDGSQPISQKKLDAAMKSLNEHVKAMAELADAHRKTQGDAK